MNVWIDYLCRVTKSQFEPDHVNSQGLCRCESFRLASRVSVLGWFGVASGSWAWAGAPPSINALSAGVVRYFCEKCGSLMEYYFNRWHNKIYFLSATCIQKVLCKNFTYSMTINSHG